jgi:hypothetical protein
MQRLKILVLAAMAVFALAAIVSSTASAALPLFLTATGTQPLLLISGLSTVVPAQLQTLAQKETEQVECPEVHYTFHQNANEDLGTFHFDFLGCHVTVPIAAKCTGLGEATAGEILALGTYHTVFDSLAPLGAAMLLLINEVHFACSIVLVKVKGELVCLIVVPGGKGTKVKLDCEKTLGDPKEFTYWNNAGTEVKIPNGLLASQSDGEFKDAAEKASGEGAVTNDAGTAEPVELMF